MRYTKLPTITGKQLIKLLQKDGWKFHRRTRHGVSLIKVMSDRTKVTVIPDTKVILPDGTLTAILGQKQTGIMRKGLLELVNKFGV